MRYDTLVTASALTPAPAFADYPAVGIPTGISDSGLPLFTEVVGRALDGATELPIGAAFEAATGFTARRPALAQRLGTTETPATGVLAA